MPTLYWLVDAELREAVSRVEAAGGVDRLEAAVDADALAATHARYAARRGAGIVRADALAPRGGVGGTREGVKCLHAHLANYLGRRRGPRRRGGRGRGRAGRPRRRGRAWLRSSRPWTAARTRRACSRCAATARRCTARRASPGSSRASTRRGVLPDAAIERSLAVLDEYRAIMDADGVGDGLLVATSAVRDAANGAEFLAAAGARTGVEARVLTGERGGALLLRRRDGRPRRRRPADGGARRRRRVDRAGDGRRRRARRSYSMQLGCVRVTERALGRGPASPGASPRRAR